ncbi:hypothetical protein C4K37_1527 [Pseudomonas chlororaphis subsp. piscium]|uniref:Uncharacterized protein n=1 Tax=Pseudomonas chlororaphis TaxID=587753 RepID=A0AAX3G570_9PSED|nr:hypothetical protein C4K37_1527 [Pseudomonas chlororaphis subsp. piscium]AZC42474.1 hypothetical protein C4K36_1534 [Pseudomonas chlororaphis subsp. piscium]VEF76850.1 Uncharacterised protein [Pseudomonas chlororaphis]
MKLTLRVEQRGSPGGRMRARGELDTLGESAGHIKQGLVKLKTKDL